MSVVTYAFAFLKYGLLLSPGFSYIPQTEKENIKLYDISK